ncbi:MAG: hypothetical protein K8W52_31515, partial [Deltaproteobacteria bacterium]|nr:hypothetical protein [Deltaproteobacteria bacterium]
ERTAPLRLAAATITCRYGDETSHITFTDVLRLARDTVKQALRLRRVVRGAPRQLTASAAA